MDKNMIEKKITAVTEQIRKDEAESERTAAQIRRAQDRKHFLVICPLSVLLNWEKE